MSPLGVRKVGAEAVIIMYPLHPTNTIPTKWCHTNMEHKNQCASAFALSAKQSGSQVDGIEMQNEHSLSWHGKNGKSGSVHRKRENKTKNE